MLAKVLKSWIYSRKRVQSVNIYILKVGEILILVMVMDKLSAIIGLLTALSSKGSVNSKFLEVLLKITGIAFLTEFAVSVCNDSGETAIASKVDLGGKILIISLSIPIIAALLELILKILP